MSCTDDKLIFNKLPIMLSILKEINPEYSLEGLMLNLKPIFWPPDMKNWLIGKDPDAGKDWRQEEKGMTEDEMVGWHHWLNEHEFEQTPGASDGQGGLACYGSHSCKESDTTERLHFLFFLSYNQPAQELTTIWYQTKTFCSCYKLLQHCHYIFSQLSSTNGV